MYEITYTETDAIQLQIHRWESGLIWCPLIGSCSQTSTSPPATVRSTNCLTWISTTLT